MCVCAISRSHSKQLANHNALGQLNTQNTFRISEGGASSKQEVIGVFETDWEMRCCNNVKHDK